MLCGDVLHLHLHSDVTFQKLFFLNVNSVVVVVVVVTCDFSIKAVSQLPFGKVWSSGSFCSVLIQAKIAWI